MCLEDTYVGGLFVRLEGSLFPCKLPGHSGNVPDAPACQWDSAGRESVCHEPGGSCDEAFNVDGWGVGFPLYSGLH